MSNFEKLLKEISSNKFKDKVLILSGEEIDDNKIIKLAMALKKNQYIIELDINNNRITSVGAKALARIKLKILNIDGNPIGDEGTGYITKKENLLELSAQSCDITKQRAKVLFENGVLQYLDLSFNQIGKEGFETLPTNTVLKKLILRQGIVDSDCAELIAQNHSLETVHLPTNSIGDRGAMSLALNSTIENLDLSQTDIGDLGAGAFGINNSVKNLNFFNCHITSAATKFLSMNRTLIQLDLSFNRLDNDCVPYLKLLPLRSLSLTHNQITPIGQAALRKLKNIKILGLGYNPTKEPRMDGDKIESSSFLPEGNHVEKKLKVEFNATSSQALILSKKVKKRPFAFLSEASKDNMLQLTVRK